jgi:hypothetical protein
MKQLKSFVEQMLNCSKNYGFLPLETRKTVDFIEMDVLIGILIFIPKNEKKLSFKKYFNNK